MVLDLGKKKMSKSFGNAVQPKEVIEKFSRDYLRYVLAKKSTGLDMTFDWKELEDVHGFFNVLSNTFNFAQMYLNIDFSKKQKAALKALPVEDKWLLSKFNSLSLECSKAFENYEFFKRL